MMPDVVVVQLFWWMPARRRASFVLPAQGGHGQFVGGCQLLCTRILIGFQMIKQIPVVDN